MSDRQPTTELSAEALPRALRNLAQAEPPAGGWDALAASLQQAGLVKTATPASHEPHRPQQPRRRPAARRRWIAAAVAASLGLLALALVPLNGPAPPPQQADAPSSAAATTAPATVAASTDAADAELAQLRGESARTEEWLRSLRADETPLDGRSLMAATEIEDMIGLIDLQLAAGSDSGSEARALWRSRVELLRDLAAVRTTYSLAGTGIAANGTAAVPDNWTTL